MVNAKYYFSVMFVGTFLFITGLHADKCDYEVDAETINYDGRKIEFVGDVIFVHELGKISAQSAVVVPGNEDEDGDVAKVEFAEEVTISIRDQSTIHCEKGVVDFVNHEIQLYGGNGQQVNYVEKHPDGKPKITVVSEKMVMEYDNTPSVYNIIAYDGVIVEDPLSYTAVGDKGVFVLDESITLYPKEDQVSRCVISTKQGATVEAGQITYDPKLNQFQLHDASGKLTLSDQSEITFTSDSVTWHEADQILTMMGKSCIEQTKVVNLQNDTRVTFFWKDDALNYITSKGHTVINRLNNQGGVGYSLITDGKLELDYQRNHLEIDKVDKQIHYNDSIGNVFGDRLSIDYTVKDQGLLPTKVFLEGNLKLMSNAYALTTENVPIAQYALADSLVYTPDTEEVLLFSKDKKRVLFYDKMNNLQISAPRIRYAKGKATGKDMIQGLGDVRLRFLKQELEQFKKRFNFE